MDKPLGLMGGGDPPIFQMSNNDIIQLLPHMQNHNNNQSHKGDLDSDLCGILKKKGYGDYDYVSMQEYLKFCDIEKDIVKGQTAFITGANRGVGKAILEEFAKNGLNVIAHARKRTDEFIAYVENIKNKYKIDVYPIFFELTNSDEMKKALKPLIVSKESIDILVNCAGIAHVSMFAQTPISKIKEIFDINYFSQLELIQLMMKKMTKQQFGSVINIGSITGLIVSEGQIPYATSKLSLMYASKNLAAEYGRFNIRFNSIALGLVDTDMKKNLNDDEIKYFETRTITKRICQPQEVAKIVNFLASNDASYINGQIIRVDGGLL